MSQKESLLERILRFIRIKLIRREKLVGMCRVGDKTYEFWESRSYYMITGSDNEELFKPVRRRKYKSMWAVDIEEFLYTDDYKTYLENKNRLLASSQAQTQAATPT